MLLNYTCKGDKNMAMIQCPECQKEISDQATACPNCGTPLTPEQTQPQAQPQINITVQNSNQSTNQNVNAGGFPYKPRNKWVAFFLCLFLGFLGAHRFYVGKTGTGLIWLLTVGLGGFGWIFDLVMILIGAFRDKAGMPLVS